MADDSKKLDILAFLDAKFSKIDKQTKKKKDKKDKKDKKEKKETLPDSVPPENFKLVEELKADPSKAALTQNSLYTELISQKDLAALSKSNKTNPDSLGVKQFKDFHLKEAATYDS
jgi:hypothetical protein